MTAPPDLSEDERDALCSLWLHGPLLVASGAVAGFEGLERRGYVRCTHCDVSTRMPCYEVVALSEIQAIHRASRPSHQQEEE